MGVPIVKDYNILGSILGSHDIGKLPHSERNSGRTSHGKSCRKGSANENGIGHGNGNGNQTVMARG